MYSRRILALYILFFTCVAAVYATSDSTVRSFKSMMGDRGAWQWHKYKKKSLWKKRSVRNNATAPMELYAQAITHLDHPPINTVPKILHFIWIGPNPIPEEAIKNYTSWKKHHPHWEIFFWTDREERAIPVEGMKRRLLPDFDFGPCQASLDDSDNWSEKSDIIRFWIMYKEGGVYADHDVECIRSFDRLADHFDFVVAYEPLHPYNFPAFDAPFIPNTGVIVSRAHHPIIEKTIERLCAKWADYSDTPAGTDRESVMHRAMCRTFDPFAYCVSNFIQSNEHRNIILPTCYFHSSSCFSKKTLTKLTQQGHVYAIHRFSASWLPKKKRPPSREKTEKGVVANP